MNPLTELKNDAKGLAILNDWFGDGLVPVAQETANARALVCVHGANGVRCPHNRGGKWWERFSKNPVAEAIKRQIEVKNKIELATPHDEELEICDMCGCCMLLKVHVPMEHILKHSTQSELAAMPDYCWQRLEANL